MGSKSNNDAPKDYGPEPVPASQASDESLLQMMQIMMSQVGQGAPQPPALPDLPEVSRDVEVDWDERRERLANKARADYKNDQRRKKGRSSTIITSPLIENESPDTTSLIAAGK